MRAARPGVRPARSHVGFGGVQVHAPKALVLAGLVTAGSGQSAAADLVAEALDLCMAAARTHAFLEGRIAESGVRMTVKSAGGICIAVAEDKLTWGDGRAAAVAAMDALGGTEVPVADGSVTRLVCGGPEPVMVSASPEVVRGEIAEPAEALPLQIAARPAADHADKCPPAKGGQE
ncbi:hypothetical protein [Pseudoruegeria sp. HB172150]|uniref:hypothetical protein n=1 Tax=Pseudoruegeria sp. HB172150 TaxID=2721164 RepID=UPI00155410F5|nr:hypothetical protein [Pseudoruegeria sp. HB172150]